VRRRCIRAVIHGSCVANHFLDSHMRDLTEQGFNVVCVNDAVGALGEEAYAAAILNASMIANTVRTTAATQYRHSLVPKKDACSCFTVSRAR
jgi:nicotinamidase-related amidase